MITADDFTAVLAELKALGRQVLPLPDLALGATRALADTPLNPVGACCWLATMTQESASFRTTTEYSSTGPYAPYVGRTFEQVTWETNYAAFGRWAVAAGLIASPDLFVDRPHLLAETQWAWLGGVWYFGVRDLWGYANRGDFQRVSNAVNRGSATTNGFPSGWSARLAAYRVWTARIATPTKVTVTGVMNGPTSKRLQQWVGVGMDGAVGPVTLGAVEKWLGLPVDGVMSPSDVKVFQGRISAYVDGDWGPGTTRSLQRYLNSQQGAKDA